MGLPRSHLMIVIDGLSQKQLADLGEQFSKLSIPPIVTLVTTVPILNKEHSEEKQTQARTDLAAAGETLLYPAAIKIVDGSNPTSAVKFFLKGTFDAMIKKNSHGQLAILVKNFDATGINELNPSMVVTDLSEHHSSPHSYKGVFAKSQQAKTINDIEENKRNVSKPNDSPKPTI